MPLIPTPDRFSIALTRGASHALGAFTDSLDALTVLVAERTREAVSRNDRARRAALVSGSRRVSPTLTHLDETARARMVDVSGKPETVAYSTGHD